MMIVNGTDLSAHGFVLDADRLRVPRLGGERTAVSRIARARRGVRTGGAHEPGVISAEGLVVGADELAVVASMDVITSLLQDECVIAFPHLGTRQWVAWLQSSSVAEDAGVRDPSIRLRMEFACPDPAARAPLDTVQVIGNGNPAAALDLGSAESPQRVAITNAAGAGSIIDQVTIQVATTAGVLSTLVWTGAVAPGAALVVDGSRFTVTNAGANAIDGLSAASVFPTAEPLRPEGRGLYVYARGGTPIISTTYRKAWI